MAEPAKVLVPAATREEVVRRLRAESLAIRALGVRKLSLFGSFSRGEPGEASDVDLLVEFETGRKSFDRLLESRLGRRVELVTPEGLSPYIGPHIRAEAQDVPLAR